MDVSYLSTFNSPYYIIKHVNYVQISSWQNTYNTSLNISQLEKEKLKVIITFTT